MSYVAEPLLSFDWLTAADLVVVTLGSLVLLMVSLVWDYRDRQREKRVQDSLHRSVLDAKSRIYR